jgi:hypothetical protein
MFRVIDFRPSAFLGSVARQLMQPDGGKSEKTANIILVNVSIVILKILSIIL